MAPRTRKEKPIFRGLRIAVAGDLTATSSQWTDTNTSRWVGLRDGQFVGSGEAIDAGVTHLICEKAEFERRGSRVRDALKHQRTCHIVSLDWLEDSIHGRKRLLEEPFSFVWTLRQERERERRQMLAIKGLEQAERAVNSTLYHVHHDHTFFRYEVLLTRNDEERGIKGERYILTLHESNAKPHLYWFVARYYRKKTDTHAKFHRPSDTPGLFAREFALFESFFRKKTGVPWPQRLLVNSSNSSSSNDNNDDNNKEAGTTTDSSKITRFQYTPPARGKPVGWVPAEYMPREVLQLPESESEGAVAASGVDAGSARDEDSTNTAVTTTTTAAAATTPRDA